LQRQLADDEVREKLREPSEPSIRDRVERIVRGHWETRQMPTATQRQSLEIVRDAFAEVRTRLAEVVEETLPQLEAELEAAGAPWTPGRPLR
jgi:hypothetical protein